MDLFQLPVILAVLQWLAGWLVKRYPHIPNQAIPAITYVLALFGYAVVPADANAATSLASVLGTGGSVFAAALVQNLLVTGIHSTWKNTVFPAFAVSLNALFKRG